MQALTQPLQDSTRLVSLPAWVVNRMISEVELGRSCDSLRVQLEEGIRMAAEIVTVADSLIKAQQRQIELRDEGIKIREETLVIKDQVNAELKKELKRQKRLKVLAFVGSGVIVLLAVL